MTDIRFLFCPYIYLLKLNPSAENEIACYEKNNYTSEFSAFEKINNYQKWIHYYAFIHVGYILDQIRIRQENMFLNIF